MGNMGNMTTVQLVLAIIFLLIIGKALRDMDGPPDTQIGSTIVGVIAGVLLSIDALVFVGRHLAWR